MKLFYHDQYNYRLGMLARLHPFDGTKFERAFAELRGNKSLEFSSPQAPVDQSLIDAYVNRLVSRYLRNKNILFQALEVPRIPLVTFSWLDKKVLLPMRWGVAGTIEASKAALSGHNCWNMSGGYHHASHDSIEGFCIYNDIGIAYKALVDSKDLALEDNIIIIDVDAHHGNGNAATFYENKHVTLLDVYNADIYPTTPSTRARVDFGVPLNSGVGGEEYLSKYADALNALKKQCSEKKYRMAYIVAGTDVLSSDPLGGMGLSVEDVAERERMTLQMLQSLSIPAVFVGGGGYSKASADAIVAGVRGCMN